LHNFKKNSEREWNKSEGDLLFSLWGFNSLRFRPKILVVIMPVFGQKNNTGHNSDKHDLAVTSKYCLLFQNMTTNYILWWNVGCKTFVKDNIVLGYFFF
ncbi:hypothetical protein ACJX0J_029599, partial [Zea mays]